MGLFWFGAVLKWDWFDVGLFWIETYSFCLRLFWNGTVLVGTDFMWDCFWLELHFLRIIWYGTVLVGTNLMWNWFWLEMHFLTLIWYGTVLVGTDLIRKSKRFMEMFWIEIVFSGTDLTWDCFDIRLFWIKNLFVWDCLGWGWNWFRSKPFCHVATFLALFINFSSHSSLLHLVAPVSGLFFRLFHRRRVSYFAVMAALWKRGMLGRPKLYFGKLRQQNRRVYSRLLYFLLSSHCRTTIALY